MEVIPTIVIMTIACMTIIQMLLTAQYLYITILIVTGKNATFIMCNVFSIKNLGL